MYKRRAYTKSNLKGVEVTEAVTLEQKVEAITANKETIKDGAPLIYSERKEGVVAAYNIRTDRFEIAADAMDAIAANRAAQREARINPKEDDKVKQLNPDGEVSKDRGSKEGGA